MRRLKNIVLDKRPGGDKGNQHAGRPMEDQGHGQERAHRTAAVRVGGHL